jgi:3-hydroxyacyl-[acyl-carrier-protein] dehydratase
MTTVRTLGQVELLALLPHRWPMLLIDRAEVDEASGAVRATKAVSASEPCYRDVEIPCLEGFDGAESAAALRAGRFSYPPSLLLESMGQAAAVLWLVSPSAGAGEGLLMLATVRDYRMHGPVYPGDVVRHEVRVEKVLRGAAIASGVSTVEGRAVASVGSLIAVRRPAGALARAG